MSIDRRVESWRRLWRNTGRAPGIAEGMARRADDLLDEALGIIRRLRGELEGKCPTCSAPRGVYGCDLCDAALCAACVHRHEHRETA